MKQSAGILLVRKPQTPEFFLVHPGGPYFRNKDAGYWTIPKGEPIEGEELLETALREFEEETGFTVSAPFTALQPIVQKSNKKVWCWMAFGEIEAENIVCNTFEIEWPPHSGKQQSFPEIDKAGWFGYEEALQLINERQRPFLTEALSSIHQSKKT
ncbi:NUDIX domain-containing protein [Chitinophaga silvatica]|uniref:NUDIX domain-containing protein n=1 Tax=Chitinophaga silvatica TaxID=2282649 RepID=A0A3E1YGS1_9BACT|nr:NUDIX domain-containing protein [Chitinophaga silvatica]RFS26601.1 NUDIX domain-containing protein [Chitinophaga silvatica]